MISRIYAVRQLRGDHSPAGRAETAYSASPGFISERENRYGSVLTFDIRAPDKIGDVSPGAHFQALRNPFQAYGRLGAEPPGWHHFVRIALALNVQLLAAPSDLRLLFVRLAALNEIMVLPRRILEPILQARDKIFHSEAPPSTDPQPPGSDPAFFLQIPAGSADSLPIRRLQPSPRLRPKTVFARNSVPEQNRAP